ncbi:MAG: 4Fe-4S dicluster domain-containing protein [Promethearchaeota archaeon]
MPRHEFIVVDPERCTGCEICETICSFAQEGVFNPLLSRIKRVRIEPIINIALACNKCEDPECVRACPQKALIKDEKTGNILLIDANKCDGCGFCIRACPFGAVSLSLDGKSLICDLCEHTDYDEPQCIVWCPTECISLRTIDQLAEEKRIDAVKRLLSDLMQGKAES